MSLTIALAGNPNAGKSSLFNALTGSRQHVGNWPGKTVERKEGRLKLRGQEITIVDLPGTYSLSAFSPEEIIARDFITLHKPDVVIAVVDATNLERNLYLVVQLLEIGIPLILALNMTDLAEARGIFINEVRLSAKLGGIPVVKTVGSRQIGLETLKAAIKTVPNAPPSLMPLLFDEPLKTELAALERLCQQSQTIYPAHWLAIKLLEEDQSIREQLAAQADLLASAQAAAARIRQQTDEDPDTLIADSRYRFIAELAQEVMNRPIAEQLSFSEKLDKLLTHRIWGIPIFLFLMWVVFQLTANVSAPFLDWIDSVMNGLIAHRTLALLASLGLQDTWLASLLVDGVIAGVGGVLAFMPVLLCLYLAIAILEDSGYMARAAFVMDRLMHRIGLHGKSFLPLIVGFGCNVPAIYATRTLENETDRKITGFLITFMSCGARLPVYVIFGTAFFGASSGNFVFAMYLLGMGVAVVTSLLLTRIAFRDKPTPPFVMELPPYRLPNSRTVLIHMWERTADFLKNAGTVILAASLLIWFLMATPIGGGRFGEIQAEDSLLGTVSQTVALLFAPAGFGQWQPVSALVTGLAAKEVVVSAMNQIYTRQNTENEPLPSFRQDVDTAATGFGEAAVLTLQELLNIAPRTLNLMPGVHIAEIRLLRQETTEEVNTKLETALQESFTLPAALAFNVFILLYVPCMSAIAAMRHEFGTRWVLMQVFYTLFVAWVAAVSVYQVGQLF